LKQYWEKAVVVPDEINSLNSGSECDGQSDSKSSSPSNQEPDGVKKNKVENMFLLKTLHLAPKKNLLGAFIICSVTNPNTVTCH
jgi:hypothetical protein